MTCDKCEHHDNEHAANCRVCYIIELKAGLAVKGKLTAERDRLRADLDVCKRNIGALTKIIDEQIECFEKEVAATEHMTAEYLYYKRLAGAALEYIKTIEPPVDIEAALQAHKKLHSILKEREAPHE